ncbi:AAA family ATPase [Ralstonia pseudosolanacearum]|uniref:ATP-binding protein n=1 Tax=Ralstonia pseudosolanacearum TaxID=1310165 RepID=UPI0018A3CC47|nr:ATP-binding protein [Ralstonia pseudosolanacearum]BCL93396.1 hypothetical protein MAFF211479_30970 [Ralstonia solanacearum]BCN05963.1 hypothetical protein RPSB_31000 [Ralstonia solanacearum]
MIVRGVKLRAVTDKGEFGFAFEFARNLTIIRARNSSGKSTLFNSVLYALGMEELVGGKNERALPYAVKEHFEFSGNRIPVTASEILLEVENQSGRVVTLRRAIRDTARSTKLVEVFDAAHLTRGEPLVDAKPTYVHDKGGAQWEEGFHHFLESFMGLSLPNVATTTGGETRLYLQTIFAALAVEQKRGWTDYIATIPFFGIRDARTRVVEFLLGLGVFETNALRNRLNAESVEIDSDWRRAIEELRREAVPHGVTLEGVASKPTALFQAESVVLRRLNGNTAIDLSEHIRQLRYEHDVLQHRADEYSKVTGAEALQEVTATSEELQKLSVLHERATTAWGEQRAALKDYEVLLAEANEDLERNKAAAKLRDLGAKNNLKTAIGLCPTCNQSVDNTLLADAVTGPQMDLATNIAYLESQRRMLQRQIVGLREGIVSAEARVAELEARLAAKHDILFAMRSDVTSGATESKAIVRRQVQIEVEVEALEQLQSKATTLCSRLTGIADRLKHNQAARQRLPKDAYTADDHRRIEALQFNFRGNAGSFGYESVPITDIIISKEALVPSLADMELRAIRTDINSDSSASDFVRLIWSYLLALYQTSSAPGLQGNHPGVLMFDEPGQHSMAADSQHALLKQLAGETGLQSIVAASFDETEEVFRQATEGIDFKLIEWEGKLLRPL